MCSFQSSFRKFPKPAPPYIKSGASTPIAHNSAPIAACVLAPFPTPAHLLSKFPLILPDLGAGCSMADMANLDQTLECWAALEETCPDQRIVPITYMNSSAAIKAFVGEHGGAVCTSSNCRNVLEWALRGTGAS